MADRFAVIEPNPTPVNNPVVGGPQATMTAEFYQKTPADGVSSAQTAQAPTPTPTFTSSPSPTLTATASPTPTATPKRGATRVSPVDHMISVYIPAGTFKIGAKWRWSQRRTAAYRNPGCFLDEPDTGHECHVCKMRSRRRLQ